MLYRYVAGMCAEQAVQAERSFAVTKDALLPPFIHKMVPVSLLGKKPGLQMRTGRTGIPAAQNSIADTFREWDIAVCMVFQNRDMKETILEDNAMTF